MEKEVIRRLALQEQKLLFRAEEEKRRMHQIETETINYNNAKSIYHIIPSILPDF